MALIGRLSRTFNGKKYKLLGEFNITRKSAGLEADKERKSGKLVRITKAPSNRGWDIWTRNK